MSDLTGYGVTGAEALEGARTASEAFAQWQQRWTAPEVFKREAERLANARAEREQQRAAAAPPADLTVDALLAKLGFTREFAEHLMQPYCYCGHGHDGWDYCEHARDLGWPSRFWTNHQATAL